MLYYIFACQFKYIPGHNYAFYGCPNSAKHGLSPFKITVVRADDGEQTSSSKKKARAEWLYSILRTRDMTAELKKRIDANNIYVCETHFKPDCILTSKFELIFALVI